MTLVALPLHKLELTYLVRHGRRWTALEHLLLWLVGQDARSLADLRAGTEMPPRLLVEALVNLLKVGWIELTTVGRGTGSAVLFTANSRGRAVATMQDLPYAFDIEKRYATLYVERLTGRVLKEDQVQVRHKDQIDSLTTLVLKPCQDKHMASPAHFFDSLRLRPDDHFERPLDHRVTSSAHHSLLEVTGEHVGGLPDDVPAQLVEAILRRMPPLHWATSAAADAVRARASRPLTAHARFAPTAISESDLLIGGPEHKRELKRMLRDARRVIFVHSTFIGRAIEQFLPDLEAAAARGVDVVLLWGERKDVTAVDGNKTEIAGRLVLSRLSAEARERVRLGRDPTGSHAKVLLADSGAGGTYQAVVGSCNWLSATYAALELSVRLREPRLVREIAGVLADMSRPASGAWGRDVTTLLKVADACRSTDTAGLSGDVEGARAMLVVDDEHYAAVRDVRNASARRVVVGCDLFGPAARTTVFEPLGAAARMDGTAVTVLYNRPTEAFDEGLDDIVSDFASPRTSVSRCPGLHGKFLAWNNETLIVTSFNWLSASTMAGRFSVDELGILIHDPDLVPKLVRRILRMARADEATDASHDETSNTGPAPCQTL